ncbi:MAG: SIS domain-containing protein [Ruminococcaceae bacterium]|nr:SIS domain-containing protein [Oscillospiraceae bacterium]
MLKNLEILIERYPVLDVCKGDIAMATAAMVHSYETGGKTLLCGNGGSCADCDHIVGELMKGFLKKRPMSEEKKEEMMSACSELEYGLLSKLQCGLPAISLPSITALGSAFNNDVDPELTYAQAAFALGKRGDIFIGLSTSGNAKNVCAAAKVAKALGMTVISFTGEGGGKLAALADIAIRVPECETYKIQELHLPVYHAICADVEEHFFSE